MKFIGTFPEAVLNSLPQPEKGETAIIEETKKCMVYDGTKWIEASSNDFSLTLLEINRMLINNCTALSSDELTEKINAINTFQKETKNTYYMLYGQELNYFTVFSIGLRGQCATLGQGVIDCLNTISDKILVIDLTQAHDAYEIWIKLDNGPALLYLFPYDSGIVTVGG